MVESRGRCLGSPGFEGGWRSVGRWGVASWGLSSFWGVSCGFHEWVGWRNVVDWWDRYIELLSNRVECPGSITESC